MANWRTYINPSVGDGQNTLDGIIANGSTYGIQISDDLNVTGLSTFSDTARFSGTVRLDGELRDGDNSFGSSGQVLSSDGTDTRWVNAGTLSAGAASQIAINADNSTNASRFITFVNSGSGNNDLKTDTGLTYNPNANEISASIFEAGNGSGSVAMTINDGYGNSNLCFNHKKGIPDNTDTTASSGRIECSTDSATANMYFELYDNVTTGSATGGASTNISLALSTTAVTSYKNILPNSDSSIDIGSNSVRFANGYFDTVTGNLTGNVTGNVSGNASGNASTATTLQTARNIGGVSFDGSANIDLPGVNSAGNQNTSGNAATATTLANSRNFSISGEITANAVSFNGGGNVTLSATVDNDVIDEANLKISNDPVNGRFLQCNTSVSGGLTWAQVTVPAANTLTGTTLASGISASSLTSVGTLSSLNVSGTTNLDSGADIDGGQVNIRYDHNTTPSLYVRNNAGSANTPIIAQFQGDADSLVIKNIAGGDYEISNTQQTNGIRFYDGTGGVTLVYNNVVSVEFDSGNNFGDFKGVPSVNGTNLARVSDSITGTAGGFTSGNAALLNTGTIPDQRLSNSSLFVTGMIMMYTGSSAPSGWAICNGSNGTPDLRNKFIVSTGSSYNHGDTGGLNSVTLTEAQMPNHNHTFSGSHSHNHNINNHTHSFSGSNTHNHNFQGVNANDHNDTERNATVMRNDSNTMYTATSPSGVQNKTITISGTTGNPSDRATNSKTVSISGNTGGKGSGNSHENRPPYYALMFIMKL